MISAIYQGTFGDLIARLISIIGVSTPVFWFALILILIFAYHLDWFPIGGVVEEFGAKACSSCCFNSFTSSCSYSKNDTIKHA